MVAALTPDRIRRVRPSDAGAIADLYRPYVLGSHATFETEPPTADDIAARIAKVAGRYPWLVATDSTDALLGYAYATQFRERAAYRFAVETSIYLAPAAQGRGLGGKLYALLTEILTQQGFVHAIGALSLPNPASEALHRRAGFVDTGGYRDIGYKFGRWISVGLYQKALNPLVALPSEPLPPERASAWANLDP